MKDITRSMTYPLEKVGGWELYKTCLWWELSDVAEADIRVKYPKLNGDNWNAIDTDITLVGDISNFKKLKFKVSITFELDSEP